MAVLPRPPAGRVPGSRSPLTTPETASEPTHPGAPEEEVEEAREPEPWELPPEVFERPARLKERSIGDLFAKLDRLTLADARAILRAYRSISRGQLDLGGWGPAARAVNPDAGARASLAEITRGRAALREAALREFERAGGADLDVDEALDRACNAVIESLSRHALRGGDLEEATEAATIGAQDVAVALLARPWLSQERFADLTAPWIRSWTAADAEAHTFDILGVLSIGSLVLVFAFLTSAGGRNLPGAAVCAVAALLFLGVRWWNRRDRARSGEPPG